MWALHGLCEAGAEGPRRGACSAWDDLSLPNEINEPWGWYAAGVEHSLEADAHGNGLFAGQVVSIHLWAGPRVSGGGLCISSPILVPTNTGEE